MGCAIDMVKCLLFVFNVVFALSGLGLVVSGVLYKLHMDEYTQYLSDHLEVAPTLLIVVGSIVFIIAFFGCCGAVRENHCMVVTYAVLLLTVFLIQVALGVYLYLQSDGNDIDSTLEKEYIKVFDKYHKDPIAAKSIDSIQSGLQCCGVHGPTDYVSRFADTSVPISCCKDPHATSTCSIINLPSYWTEGCLPKFDKLKDKYVEIAGIVAIAVAVIEIVGIIFALCLANSIKNAERRMGV